MQRRQRGASSPLNTSKTVTMWSALLIAVTMSLFVGSTSTASATSKGTVHHYVVGGAIAALKVSRLQMLSAQVGVGVVPITTYAGRLARAFLVRTNDAGATWTITGTFPNEFYPFTTAFTTPKEGYVINGDQALFTRNAGASWRKVSVLAGPVGIGLSGDVAWIEVEDCHGASAMQGPCVTRLESYRVGHLRPMTITSLPTDQPPLAHVGPTQGYVFGGGNSGGNVFVTSDSGTSWRIISNPCERDHITGGSASSATNLFIFCQVGSPGNVNTSLFSSDNGGTTWREISQPPVNGVFCAVGSTGRYLWGFGTDAQLWESSDFGALWSVSRGVKFGVNDNIATYGSSDAWHAVVGHGIYRTLNGTTWVLLK